jgi:pimeloyl-ACP methyl ester carboxylesterase
LFQTADENLRDTPIDLCAGTGIESRWVDVDGLPVHYRYSPGSGPMLLVLQGGIFDSPSLTWKRVLEALPASYRVFAPALPGYGESAKPDAPYTTAYYVDFVARFMDLLAIDRACVFGSSMSGATVLGFALRYPHRARALVLSGAYGFQPRLPLHELAYAACRLPGLAGALRRLFRLDPRVVRLALRLSVHKRSHITDELVADSYRGVLVEDALTAFFRWMRSETLPHRVRSDYTSRLHELALPVLLLHGVHDWTMPVRYARRAARLLPAAELHTFDDCAHLVPRERPAEASAFILDFLQRALRDGHPEGDG